jgi:hypothetical protein
MLSGVPPSSRYQRDCGGQAGVSWTGLKNEKFRNRGNQGFKNFKHQH